MRPAFITLAPASRGGSLESRLCGNERRITSADYAFAETGSMVMISGPKQARLISLLPPVHIAIFKAPGF